MKSCNNAIKALGIIVSLCLYIASIAIAVMPDKAHAAAAPMPAYTVCFTPGQNCTELIVGTINGAKLSILVQAYSFTSAPIAKALIGAKGRGVDVRVLLDKSQRKEHYSSYAMLQNQHIPVWIDSRVAIAHNKVMVIDAETVITGSFNFTKAAQFKNAENVLVIQDKSLAAAYTANWRRRLSTVKGN